MVLRLNEKEKARMKYIKRKNRGQCCKYKLHKSENTGIGCKVTLHVTFPDGKKEEHDITDYESW